MIKVGNILIDPDSIDTIVLDNKQPYYEKEKGIHIIQIIYKSGVVKNFTSQQIGMSYQAFVENVLHLTKKAEEKKLFKIIAALNTKPNA